MQYILFMISYYSGLFHLLFIQYNVIINEQDTILINLIAFMNYKLQYDCKLLSYN
jgi:hypothetical protein